MSILSTYNYLIMKIIGVKMKKIVYVVLFFGPGSWHFFLSQIVADLVTPCHTSIITLILIMTNYTLGGRDINPLYPSLEIE